MAGVSNFLCNIYQVTIFCNVKYIQKGYLPYSIKSLCLMKKRMRLVRIRVRTHESL
jgi:hypothetical protein